MKSESVEKKGWFLDPKGKRLYYHENGFKTWCIEPYSTVGEGGHMGNEELQSIADRLNQLTPKE